MISQTNTNAPLPKVSSAESTHRSINNVNLHVVTAGDPDDPLVVLLHGYPEFWYGWYQYIEPLVSAGYRVLVPDQRGYNRSDKPDGSRHYRVSKLSTDIAELIESENSDSAHVVGHDWGAAVAWDLALRHPDTVDRLGIINVPHPIVFEETLKSNPRQMRKSWYMFFFQLPRIPEWYQRRRNFQQLADALNDSKDGAFTDEDIDRYRTAWKREEALTGMINWYRALLRHSENPPKEQVEAPTLVIWGEEDDYLLSEMASKSVEYCEDGRLERFPNATHWIHHEYPERVVDLIVDHIGS